MNIGVTTTHTLTTDPPFVVNGLSVNVLDVTSGETGVIRVLLFGRKINVKGGLTSKHGGLVWEPGNDETDFDVKDLPEEILEAIDKAIQEPMVVNGWNETGGQ